MVSYSIIPISSYINFAFVLRQLWIECATRLVITFDFSSSHVNSVRLLFQHPTDQFLYTVPSFMCLLFFKDNFSMLSMFTLNSVNSPLLRFHTSPLYVVIHPIWLCIFVHADYISIFLHVVFPASSIIFWHIASALPFFGLK